MNKWESVAKISEAFVFAGLFACAKGKFIPYSQGSRVGSDARYFLLTCSSENNCRGS